MTRKRTDIQALLWEGFPKGEPLPTEKVDMKDVDVEQLLRSFSEATLEDAPPLTGTQTLTLLAAMNDHLTEDCKHAVFGMVARYAPWLEMYCAITLVRTRRRPEQTAYDPVNPMYRKK